MPRTTPGSKFDPRDYNLYQRHGITRRQYDEILASQGGVCAICQQPPRGQNLAVDHDHTTGERRGLLCGRCNRSLGAFEDNPKTLETAARYVRHHRGVRGSMPTVTQLDEYQDNIARFDWDGPPAYYALGLVGEAGEAAEVVKKSIRPTNHKGYRALDEARIEDLKLELGDALWYLARLANRVGLRLSEVAQANITKLEARHPVS